MQPELPVEILTLIATADYGYCYREMLAIPPFARFAIKNRKWLYTQMTERIDGETDSGFLIARPMTEYKLFGKYHREDGPAVIIYGDSVPGIKKYQWYYQYGELHREGGPAVIIGSKRERIYINTPPYFSNTTHNNGISVDEFGRWYIKPIYSRKWYQHGELHREDGPAIISSNRPDLWYVNGELRKEGRYYKLADSAYILISIAICILIAAGFVAIMIIYR